MTEVFSGGNNTKKSAFETRFNSILSGKTDSLSIREILEYYIRDHYTVSLREGYDYCWSRFPAPFEMNAADLLEILSELFRQLGIRETRTVLDYLAGRYASGEEGSLETVLALSVLELMEKCENFEKGKAAPAEKGMEPLGHRPSGFDATLQYEIYEVTATYMDAAEILGGKKGRVGMTLSKVVIWNCSALCAGINLTEEEYGHFVEVYDGFFADQEKYFADLDMYQSLHGKIMSEFEKYFPYTLIYYDIAKDLTEEDGKKYRSWYAEGITGEEALDRFYE